MCAVEVAANSARALTGLETLRSLDGLSVGAGTILSPGSAERCLAAGAEYLVMPHVDEELIAWIVGRGVPALPGAFTATEAVRAWNAGAAAIKLFPGALSPAPDLGPAYLSALRGPLADVAFVPTGGISDANAAAFLAEGAVAVAAASWLVPERATELDAELVGERARRLLAAVVQGRAARQSSQPIVQETR